MKEDKRLHYLQAMEIDSWLLREDLKLAGAKAGEQKIQSPLITPQASTQSKANPVAEKPIVDLTWDELGARVAQHIGNESASVQSQFVLGAGNPQADLFIIGMRPDASTVQKGRSNNPSNKLFNAILRAMCLSEQDCYISSLLHAYLKKDPNPQIATAATSSLPFLQQQLYLAKPKLILVLGSFSAQQMLNSTAKLGELREQEFSYGANNTPLRVTYHPEDLLAQPKEKAQAWRDLQLLIQRLRALRNA